MKCYAFGAKFDTRLKIGHFGNSGVPRGRRVQQIQLRTKDRESGDLGVVAP